jgi:hypothetical protein
VDAIDSLVPLLNICSVDPTVDAIDSLVPLLNICSVDPTVDAIGSLEPLLNIYYQAIGVFPCGYDA